ncbi:modular serine protease-like isoform X15 [Daktulosphaira vitifoliae]|uniref:modular serine protease-like isoform X15 n=1 Tax=Daktulosphaira vitifoliae TaxID=58002 RepID=UPI0021AA81BF|nr:modular serine protease-like isoform X15 [Daktulosphaira vitifoliae]
MRHFNNSFNIIKFGNGKAQESYHSNTLFLILKMMLLMNNRHLFHALIVLDVLIKNTFGAHLYGYRKQTTCPIDFYRCSNGDCIDFILACDGKTDCSDNSDETESLCSTHSKTCPDFVFRCLYGACVNNNVVCDGNFDCIDKSDEYNSICYPKFFQSTTNPTIQITTKKVLTKCESTQFQCDSGECIDRHFLCDGTANCQDRTDETRKICENFRCRNNSFTCNYGACIPEKYKCDGHKNCADGSDEIKCDRNRTLIVTENSTQKFTSSPECGKIADQLQPLISNAKNSKPSEVPWNVGVYHKENNVYSHICGGSLISQNLVVSAAHCFYDENLNKTKDKNYFQIYVGKYHRNYDSKNENQYAKNYNIETIHIGEKYEGSKTNYSNDIAILVLSKPVNISPAVSIVCVDWNNEHPEVKNSSGLVAGWGKIDKFKEKYSDTLLTAELPFINNTSCKIYMRTNVTDHICAGSTNVSDSGVQQGDSGSGLSFQHKGSNWKIIAGHKEGQTQVDIPSYDSRTWWCHPIDIHYSTKGIQGWPKFHVQIYHYDRYGRSEIYGYGFCYVPTSPGTHTVECYTWRPIGSWKDEFRRFFLGGGAQLKTPDFVYCGTDRYRLQTEALGVVHFELNIIARNFRKYGVEL